jgi:hypothetical protein
VEPVQAGHGSSLSDVARPMPGCLPANITDALLAPMRRDDRGDFRSAFLASADRESRELFCFARSNRQQEPKTSPWPASGHDRDELDYGLGEAVFGAVITGGVRRARGPPATSRRRRSARMFEAIPSSDRSCRLRECCRT